MERQIHKTDRVPITLLGTTETFINKTNKNPCLCELMF